MRHLGVEVIDRRNLTILSELSQGDLTFLADHQVTVIASLPCYSEDNVDRQRVDGVLERSLDGLHQPALGMDSSPAALCTTSVRSCRHRRSLLNRITAGSSKLGIVFDSLLTLANMPIKACV